MSGRKAPAVEPIPLAVTDVEVDSKSLLDTEFALVWSVERVDKKPFYESSALKAVKGSLAPESFASASGNLQMAEAKVKFLKEQKLEFEVQSSPNTWTSAITSWVSWSAPSWTAVSGAESFVPPETQVAKNRFRFVVKGLAPESSNHFRVICKSLSGPSEPSAVVSVTTLSASVAASVREANETAKRASLEASRVAKEAAMLARASAASAAPSSSSSASTSSTSVDEVRLLRSRVEAARRVVHARALDVPRPSDDMETVAQGSRRAREMILSKMSPSKPAADESKEVLSAPLSAEVEALAAVASASREAEEAKNLALARELEAKDAELCRLREELGRLAAVSETSRLALQSQIDASEQEKLRVEQERDQAVAAAETAARGAEERSSKVDELLSLLGRLQQDHKDSQDHVSSTDHAVARQALAINQLVRQATVTQTMYEVMLGAGSDPALEQELVNEGYSREDVRFYSHKHSENPVFLRELLSLHASKVKDGVAPDVVHEACATCLVSILGSGVLTDSEVHPLLMERLPAMIDQVQTERAVTHQVLSLMTVE